MRHLRLFVAATLAAALVLPEIARADSAVFINEIQTGTPAAASQEFVELYNSGTEAVSLDGWELQYKAATSEDKPESWYRKAALSGEIKPGGLFLLSTKNYLPADGAMVSGLAAAGGHLRLVDKAGLELDRVGWGTANSAAGTAAAAPPAGQSLSRLGFAGDNSQDFAITPAPTPGAANPIPQPVPAPPPDPAPAGSPDLAPAGQPAGSPAPVPAPPPTPAPTPPNLTITELLVNPAGSDAAGEFIELRNDGDQPVDLKGLLLRTGSGFHDSYNLPQLSLAPAAYVAILARDSHLALTNTGGAARLTDAGGQIIDETPPYEAAPEGQAWGEFADGWQWTAHPTPGAANILEVPPPPAPKPEAVAASSSSAPAVKAAKAVKVAAAPTAKPLASKAPKAAKTSKVAAAKAGTKTGTADTLVADTAEAGTNRWLLIAALALTIGYAIYEFRYDIRNFYILAKRKLPARGGDRPAA